MNKRVQNKLETIRRKLAGLEQDADELTDLKKDYLYSKQFKKLIIWGRVFD